MLNDQKCRVRWKMSEEFSSDTTPTIPPPQNPNQIYINISDYKKEINPYPNSFNVQWQILSKSPRCLRLIFAKTRGLSHIT